MADCNDLTAVKIMANADGDGDEKGNTELEAREELAASERKILHVFKIYIPRSIGYNRGISYAKPRSIGYNRRNILRRTK